MASGKTEDVSAQRLLDAVGSELEYFSAAGERAILEALQSWPLLAAIWRTLRVERSANRGATRGAIAATDGDPPLRVLDSANGTSFEDEPIEEAGGERPPKPPPKEN